MRMSLDLLLPLSCLIGLAELARAELLLVPEEYTTISAAAGAAQAGDTVLVAPGNYWEERIRVGEGVTILSTAGRTQTWIGGREGEPTIEFLSGTMMVSLSGFLIGPGYLYNPPVIVGSNPNMIVEDCAIWGSGPIDWYDPGIVLYNGGTFRNCEIENGHEFHMFWLVNPGAQLLVEDCVLGRNLYPFGLDGFQSGASLFFRNCTFDGSHFDPGIYNPEDWATDISIEFENCIFYRAYYIGTQGSEPPVVPNTLEFRYTCRYGGEESIPDGAEGPGNFHEDPLICEDPNWGEDTPYEAWLEPDSPCIGTGLGGENIGARYGICGLSGVENPPLGLSPATLRAWPNPARGRVWIELASPAAIPTAVEVVDVLGRRVATLPASPGVRELEWDTRDALGEDVPAGVYLLRLLSADAQVPGASASATRLTVIR